MAVELVINGVADTYDSISQELLQAVVKAKGVGKFVAKDESEQVYSKADFPVSEGKVIVEEINVAKMLELLETRKDATDIIFGHDFYVAKA